MQVPTIKKGNNMFQSIALLVLMMLGSAGTLETESAVVMVSLIILFTGLSFYWLLWSATIGTVKFVFQDNLNFTYIFARKITEWAAAYYAYLNGVELLAVFLLPWLLISTMSDFFAMLIQYQFLEFEDEDAIEPEDIDE